MDKPVTMTKNRLAIRRAFLDGKINAVWDIMIKCVETGTLVLYRMIESPLNSMYISK